MRGPGPIVAAVLALAASASAGEAELEGLRRDVDELVWRIEWEVRRFERSPHAALTHLLAAEPADVRKVLEEAWTTGAERNREPLERLVRFLYALPKPEFDADEAHDEPVVELGVSRIRWLPGPGFTSGPIIPSRTPVRRLPSLGALTAAHELRKLDKPDWNALLDQLRTDSPICARRTIHGEGADVAAALGEACRTDAALRTKLAGIVEESPERTLAWMAIAETRSPEFARRITARVRDLAARSAVAERDAVTFDALEPLALAYGRSSPDAALRDLAGLNALPRKLLVRMLPFSVKCRPFVAALGEAGDDRVAGAVLREFSDSLLHWPVLDGAATECAAVVRVLRDLEPRPGCDEPAREVMERIWYAGFRSHSSGSSSDGWSRAHENVGPYPSRAAQFAGLVADLGAGRIRFVDRSPSLFRRVRRTVAYDGPAASSVPPLPALRDPRAEVAPLSLSGELVERGLRLKIENTSRAPIGIDTAALHYATASVGWNEQAGHERFTGVELKLGSFRGIVESAAEGVVELAPGASHTWVTPLRDEDRSVDHIGVSLQSEFVPLGESDCPVLVGFGTTWVK